MTRPLGAGGENQYFRRQQPSSLHVFEGRSANGGDVRIATNIVIPLVLLGSLSLTGSCKSQGQGHMAHAGQSRGEPSKRAHAKATVTVHSSEAKPYDQTTERALIEINIAETFAGDIDGESTVRALELRLTEHSSAMVSMQRFSGTLGGRRGTFVLQGHEIVEDGKIKATWTVVPGSGTDHLSGLRGEGGFEGSFGKESQATLDYWFE